MEDISDKKKAIFESTLELVKTNGFHGTTMNLVAKQAGVAAGTIYHYFESKDSLICELYQHNKNMIADVVDAAFSESQSPRENFFSIWKALYNYYISHTDCMVFFEQFVNSPYNNLKNHSRFDGLFYTFFKEGIKRKQLKPFKPELLLVLTMGNIVTIAKLNKIGNIPITDQDLNQIIETFWDGISTG